MFNENKTKHSLFTDLTLKEKGLLRLEELLVLAERRMRTKIKHANYCRFTLQIFASSAIYRRDFLQKKMGMLTLKQIENFLLKNAILNTSIDMLYYNDSVTLKTN